jgi:hypothetical protein
MPRRFFLSLRRAALELLDDVLESRINPGRVFDYRTDLDGIVETRLYTAMDERRAVKSLLRIGTAGCRPNALIWLPSVSTCLSEWGSGLAGGGSGM